MNDKIKKIVKRKNLLFQSQRKYKVTIFAILNPLTQDTSDAIISSNLKYHERIVNKFNYLKTAPKPTVKN